MMTAEVSRRSETGAGSICTTKEARFLRGKGGSTERPREAPKKPRKSDYELSNYSRRENVVSPNLFFGGRKGSNPFNTAPCAAYIGVFPSTAYLYNGYFLLCQLVYTIGNRSF